ncbi:hypothetical protein CYLTODRAFT_480802, partial [Cylindrobasidium torrendii FP15055 ss-10]
NKKSSSKSKKHVSSPKKEQTKSSEKSSTSKTSLSKDMDDLVEKLGKMSVSDPAYAILYYKAFTADPNIEKCFAAPIISRPPRPAPRAYNVNTQSPNPNATPTYITGPNSIPLRTQAPRDTGPRPPTTGCYGCSNESHTVRSCPELQALIQQGKLVQDTYTGRVKMPSGQRIWRTEGENILQAYHRMNRPAQTTSYIGLENEEEDWETHVYSIEEHGDVLAMDRSERAMARAARKDLIAGKDSPIAKPPAKRSAAKARKEAPPPERIHDEEPRYNPNHVTDEEMSGIEENTPPKPMRKPIQPKSTTTTRARQSEIQQQVSGQEVMTKLLEAQIPNITVKELIACSDALALQLAQLVKKKNTGSVVRAEEDNNLGQVNHIESRSRALLIRVPLKCAGTALHAVVDSGSQLNIMKRSIYEKYLAYTYPEEPHASVRMKDASGQERLLGGQVCNIEFMCGIVPTRANVYLGPESLPFELLLGRPWQRDNLVSIKERPHGTFVTFDNFQQPDLRPMEICVGQEAIYDIPSTAQEHANKIADSEEDLADTEDNSDSEDGSNFLVRLNPMKQPAKFIPPERAKYLSRGCIVSSITLPDDIDPQLKLKRTTASRGHKRKMAEYVEDGLEQGVPGIEQVLQEASSSITTHVSDSEMEFGATEKGTHSAAAYAHASPTLGHTNPKDSETGVVADADESISAHSTSAPEHQSAVPSESNQDMPPPPPLNPNRTEESPLCKSCGHPTHSPTACTDTLRVKSTGSLELFWKRESGYGTRSVETSTTTLFGKSEPQSGTRTNTQTEFHSQVMWIAEVDASLSMPNDSSTLAYSPEECTPAPVYGVLTPPPNYTKSTDQTSMENAQSSIWHWIVTAESPYTMREDLLTAEGEQLRSQRRQDFYKAQQARRPPERRPDLRSDSLMLPTTHTLENGVQTSEMHSQTRNGHSFYKRLQRELRKRKERASKPPKKAERIPSLVTALANEKPTKQHNSQGGNQTISQEIESECTESKLKESELVKTNNSLLTAQPIRNREQCLKTAQTTGHTRSLGKEETDGLTVKRAQSSDVQSLHPQTQKLSRYSKLGPTDELGSSIHPTPPSMLRKSQTGLENNPVLSKAKNRNGRPHATFTTAIPAFIALNGRDRPPPIEATAPVDAAIQQRITLLAQEITNEPANAAALGPAILVTPAAGRLSPIHVPDSDRSIKVNLFFNARHVSLRDGEDPSVHIGTTLVITLDGDVDTQFLPHLERTIMGHPAIRLCGPTTRMSYRAPDGRIPQLTHNGGFLPLDIPEDSTQAELETGCGDFKEGLAPFESTNVLSRFPTL